MKKWVWLYLILLIVLLLLIIFAPTEKTLGNFIKLVFLHGALAKVTFYLIYVAGVLSLLFLLTKTESIFKLIRAVQQSAIVFLFISFVISIMAAALIWKTVNWQEPRFIMLMGIIGLLLAGLLLEQAGINRTYIAGYYFVIAVLLYLFTFTVERIIHPIDPIGTSLSNNIRLYYQLIAATIAAIAVTTVVRFLQCDSRCKIL